MLNVVVWSDKCNEIHYVHAEDFATRQDAEAEIRISKAVDIANEFALMPGMSYRIVDDAEIIAYYEDGVPRLRAEMDG